MSSINSGTVYGHSDHSEERVADRQGQTDAAASPGSHEGSSRGHDEPKAAPEKPGFMARLGLPPLDLPTFLMMIKGAIPPTVGIAFYQSTAVANYFTTLGYLVGIMSILSLSVLPRGKYIQTLVLNLIFVGVGAAMGLLIMWSSLQARLHTQVGPSIDPVTRRPTYNSSQSAVSGLWLFVSIWFVNVLRAKYASLGVPVILYSIFTSISATYSPIMTSNAALESIIKRMLTAMLAAFALATVTSLLFIPVPSRKVTYGQMKGLIGLLRGAVKQEKVYLQSLERDDMFATPADVCAVSVSPEATAKQPSTKANPQPNGTAEAEALRKTITAMRELIGKMQSDLPFAKRDIAWGKLDGADLKELFYHLRACLIPIVGLSTVVDIFQRIAARRGWNTDGDTPLELLAEKTAEKKMWNEIMKHLHDPLESLSEALDQGIEHAAVVLELLPKPKEAKKGETNGPDVEAKGEQLCPGDSGFSDFLKHKVKSFDVVKAQILRTWATERDLVTDDDAMGGATRRSTPESEQRHQHDQSQLFTLLYIEKLMQEIAESVQGLVAFADGKVADGTMAKNRLIVPKYRRLKKWIASIFSEQDETGENHELLGVNIVYMGDSFASKKDPEHLPPTNNWQRMGNGLRAISRFFSSEASVFGLRVACATMTIGIVNFLEPTQQFFQEQRLVWAMIMIAIGMTQTSGQSIFGFFCRVGGTVIAMVISLVNWYIVDEKVPGILAFLFIFLVLEMYFFIKFPNFLPAVLICMITHVMIIGYELQALKVGLRVTESNGQAFYPIYTLAPYRLATVAAGCLVAFIWTIFPSPLTERFWLRRDLASTLYLLANYFSVIDESLKMRLRDTGGDLTIKHCPAARLRKHRECLFGKLNLLLPSLMQHAAFQKFEPTVGGVFPRDIYEDIIRRASRITSYLALMSHTVGYSPVSSSPQDRAWVDSLARVAADVAPTKHAIICTLTLLSHSLQTGNSLPPHLPLPRPFELTRQLQSLAARSGDRGVRSLLDAQHMADNGYAEFAVLQVSSALICGDLEELVRDVAKLVGVVDFSIHIENSSSSLDTAVGDLPGPENGSDERGKGKRD